jgi:hypothetical protein
MKHKRGKLSGEAGLRTNRQIRSTCALAMRKPVAVGIVTGLIILARIIAEAHASMKCPENREILLHFILCCDSPCCALLSCASLCLACLCC